MSHSRNITALAASCAVLLGGTWATTKLATDYLVRENAMSAARSWALYLTENVGDLEQIADGEQPSAASMAFLAFLLCGSLRSSHRGWASHRRGRCIRRSD
jgi:hypothetical protein